MNRDTIMDFDEFDRAIADCDLFYDSNGELQSSSDLAEDNDYESYQLDRPLIQPINRRDDIVYHDFDEWVETLRRQQEKG
jgi:hypothetical protein